jgi:hypothetical protein
LKNLIDFLECGKVQTKNIKKNNTKYFEFRVEKFEDINKKIRACATHFLLNILSLDKNY